MNGDHAMEKQEYMATMVNADATLGGGDGHSDGGDHFSGDGYSDGGGDAMVGREDGTMADDRGGTMAGDGGVTIAGEGDCAMAGDDEDGAWDNDMPSWGPYRPTSRSSEASFIFN
jgi:hypothetical protein